MFTWRLLKVPWPASIVINDETILLCNKIFIFLLQIKRAKWSLEQIIWRGDLSLVTMKDMLSILTLLAKVEI